MTRKLDMNGLAPAFHTAVTFVSIALFAFGSVPDTMDAMPAPLLAKLLHAFLWFFLPVRFAVHFFLAVVDFAENKPSVRATVRQAPIRPAIWAVLTVSFLLAFWLLGLRGMLPIVALATAFDFFPVARIPASPAPFRREFACFAFAVVLAAFLGGCMVAVALLGAAYAVGSSPF